MVKNNHGVERTDQRFAESKSFVNAIDEDIYKILLFFDNFDFTHLNLNYHLLI